LANLVGDPVILSEVAMAAAVTLSIGGVAYAALNTDAVTQPARTVASAADCRAVDTAITAYVAEWDRTPTTLDEIRPYILGDISAYRIVEGLATGPGCP
jgi:hypothetical protein